MLRALDRAQTVFGAADTLSLVRGGAVSGKREMESMGHAEV